MDAAESIGSVAHPTLIEGPAVDPNHQKGLLEITLVSPDPRSFADQPMPAVDFPGQPFLIKPHRVGPSDRLGFATAGWSYFEVSMNAQAFLSINGGRLSLRGIPLPVVNEDKWEPAMSTRSLIQYWFDETDKQDPNKLVENTVVNYWVSTTQGWQYTMQNYISPWSNDTSLWDFQVAAMPPSTVTVAILRPLRRGATPPGWYRWACNLPTRRPKTPTALPDGQVEHTDLFTQFGCPGSDKKDPVYHHPQK
jgi:hypothetical protein